VAVANHSVHDRIEAAAGGAVNAGVAQAPLDEFGIA
jgi:hypothetical protein